MCVSNFDVLISNPSSGVAWPGEFQYAEGMPELENREAASRGNKKQKKRCRNSGPGDSIPTAVGECVPGSAIQSPQNEGCHPATRTLPVQQRSGGLEFGLQVLACNRTGSSACACVGAGVRARLHVCMCMWPSACLSRYTHIAVRYPLLCEQSWTAKAPPWSQRSASRAGCAVSPLPSRGGPGSA